MRWVALAILVLGAGCGGPGGAPAPAAASLRTIRGGDVVGFAGRYGSFVWQGLPYAAPPVGERRWRAPAPPAAWKGVREALRPGSPCVQYASPLGGVQTARANTPVGSEDCLYLNVYAPRDVPRGAALPVMVWIHGGGNSIGAGDLYDGGNLAATEHVVVVTVNYRLGPFGWFRHAALRAADGTTAAERSGNFAVLDLVRALEWVRDDIAAFGGDPTRVTVFGESAGGTNTLLLLMAPQAQGLFHRAIVESGGLETTDPTVAEAFADDPGGGSRDSASEVAARLLVRGGRAADRDDAKRQLATMAPGDVARRLRAVSAVDLLEAYTPLPGIGMVRLPIAFAEGTVVPRERPAVRFARRDGWNRMPVLIGTNRDENKLFMFFTPTWVQRWFWIVPRLRDPERYDATAEILAKVWKAGLEEFATAMVSSGATDVYSYRFDWNEEPVVLGADLARMLGAAHGLEVPFVFGHFDLGREANVMFTRDNEPGRTALSRAVMSYWTAFATTGRPAHGRRDELPAWPAWGAQHRFQVLDTEAGGGIRPSDDVLTRDAVLATVDTEPRLTTPRDRCVVWHDLVTWSRALPRESYDAKCPDHPFDAYPWSS